ncbi:MAG: ComEC/Rec2 family competence protein [Dethiobacteria bacterium]
MSPARIKSISSLAAVTLAAQLGVIPFTAFYFREISLIALFSNMLILPVMSAVLSVGSCCSIVRLY